MLLFFEAGFTLNYLSDCGIHVSFEFPKIFVKPVRWVIHFPTMCGCENPLFYTCYSELQILNKLDVLDCILSLNMEVVICLSYDTIFRADFCTISIKFCQYLHYCHIVIIKDSRSLNCS